jgi:ketosteroid isomerase-like protein
VHALFESGKSGCWPARSNCGEYSEQEAHLTAHDRLQAVRDCYGAYVSGDRSVLERHLTADFVFSAPPDVGIDRATYFERCWPSSRNIAGYDYDRFFEKDGEVFVTYECTRSDGTRFRNTEIFGFDGDGISRVEVYFGWNVA